MNPGGRRFLGPHGVGVGILGEDGRDTEGWAADLLPPPGGFGFDLFDHPGDLRESKEMTRAGLAEASGVPLWAVAECERGESSPDRPTLTRLLAALGSSPAELAGLLSWLGEAEDPALAGNGLTRALEVLVAGRLTPRLRPVAAIESSSHESPAAAASRAWELFASWPLAEQLALVEDIEAVRDLALYDAIRSESERWAAGSPRARELATLAAAVLARQTYDLRHMREEASPLLGRGTHRTGPKE